MPSRQVYPLASGEGFATVVNGHCVSISSGYGGKFYVHVCAFMDDDNSQHNTFNSAAEAVEWGVDAAAVHQGRCYECSDIEYWEIHNGHFITIERVKNDEYKPDRHPIWVDSEHVPVMGLVERFPTQDEALAWIRQTVDEETRMEDSRQRELQELKESLESVP